MGRAHAKKYRLCHSVVSQAFRQPQWIKFDLQHSSESEKPEKLEQIFGHQIVASANVLWCIGGYRPVEQVKISLIALDLLSLQWDDLTPGEECGAHLEMGTLSVCPGQTCFEKTHRLQGHAVRGFQQKLQLQRGVALLPQFWYLCRTTNRSSTTPYPRSLPFTRA